MKKWYHSRLLWVNGLVLVASIISGITGNNWLDGELQLMVLSVIDLVLRWRTSQGLQR